jgi:hypothetical protein
MSAGGVSKMSFYVWLVLAFGLGFVLRRPIFDSNPASDLQDEDFDRRFFRDP